MNTFAELSDEKIKLLLEGIRDMINEAEQELDLDRRLGRDTMHSEANLVALRRVEEKLRKAIGASQ